MTISIHPEAQVEFDEAADYYRDHAARFIAERFVEDFEHVMRLAVGDPELGSRLSARSRSLLFRHFPYRLVYQAVADMLVVVAVAHQRRRPGYWRRRQ